MHTKGMQLWHQIRLTSTFLQRYIYGDNDIIDFTASSGVVCVTYSTWYEL